MTLRSLALLLCVLAALCFSLVSSASRSFAGGEIGSLAFCPPSSEEVVRKTLDLHSRNELGIDDFLGDMEQRQIAFEVSIGNTKPRKCKDYKALIEPMTYSVFAGFDETKSFTRNYLVVADTAGTVRYIEERNAYPAVIAPNVPAFLLSSLTERSVAPNSETTEMHDFEKQRAETFATWESLSESDQFEIPETAILDLQFFPANDTADRARFEDLLLRAGYSLSSLESDDGTLEASFGPIKLSAETIWQHEKATTRLALQCGFKPDGWGLLIDQ